MSLTFLPQKNILEKLVAFHPSSRTPHTLVPSHAACTLWTGPVTVTSRAAGVKKEGICSPSAMGLAPFRGVEPVGSVPASFGELHFRTCLHADLEAKTELHGSLPISDECTGPFLEKVPLFLLTKFPRSRAVCKKFPPFPRIKGEDDGLFSFQRDTVTWRS